MSRFTPEKVAPALESAVLDFNDPESIKWLNRVTAEYRRLEADATFIQAQLQAGRLGRPDFDLYHKNRDSITDDDSLLAFLLLELIETSRGQVFSDLSRIERVLVVSEAKLQPELDRIRDILTSMRALADSLREAIRGRP